MDTTQTSRDYHDEDEQPMRCQGCDRPAFYDYDDDQYHHAVDAATPCFLVPAEQRPDDHEHPLVAA